MVAPGVTLLVSEQALHRVASDARVRNNLKAYAKEIRFIGELARLNANATMVNGFHISPQGRSTDGMRVAWTIERNGSQYIIRICDLLYLVRGDDYVDDWHKKTLTGKITPRDYSSWTEIPTQLQ